MSLLRLFIAAPLLLATGMVSAPALKPAPDVLRRPGETTVFSFVAASGKTISLCEGPKGAYLVYRFGTATKTELQYPAVLNADSWSKFTYFRYFRGGGVANAGLEDYRLSFRNGSVEYELYDRTHAEAGKGGAELYPREIGLDVSAGRSIIGKEANSHGGLMLNDEQRERVTTSEDSF